jgi:HK97 family phage major capsid protein
VELEPIFVRRGGQLTCVDGYPPHRDRFERAGIATADYVLLYGDFSNYVIADRVGTRLELVPHLVGTNRRPTLQRGFILWGRVGADSVNDNAFRLLNAAI